MEAWQRLREREQEALDGMGPRAGDRPAVDPSWSGEPATDPDPDDDMAQARARLERMKFNAVKEELRRAELAFVSAKRVLPEGEQRITAGRIVEALSRCNLSVDTVEAGVAAAGAMEPLEGVSEFDPTGDLPSFVTVGGEALALAAHALAHCGVASVEYWGWQLKKLVEDF